MGTVALKWIESQLMIGVDSFGHPLVMGSLFEHEPEWGGLKPSDLLLLAAASCSTYDVIMILKKQREPVEALDVTCTGKQMDEPPFAFTHIHLKYTAKGDVNADRLARAIRLSEEKYCSVVNTLKPTVVVTSEFEIV